MYSLKSQRGSFKYEKVLKNRKIIKIVKISSFQGTNLNVSYQLIIIASIYSLEQCLYGEEKR